MSYVPANLALNNGSTLGSRSAGMREWVLRGTDALTAVLAASYISDAGDKGMTAGDFVTYLKTDTNDAVELVVSAVSSGAATLVGKAALVGAATTTPIGFYGATPIVRPSGSAQAAVATTAATSSSPFGFSSSQANGIITLLNEIRSVLVNLGLMKGAS